MYTARRQRDSGCGSGSPTADWSGTADRRPPRCAPRARAIRANGRRRAEQHARVGMLRLLEQRHRPARVSTILPRYITATRSAMWRTTPRSWLRNSIASFSSRLRVLQELENLRADRDIERRDRLVGHQDARPQRQRARDGDALALAAAELVRIAVGIERRRRKPDELQEPFGLPFATPCVGTMPCRRSGRRSASAIGWRGLSDA